MKRRKNHYITKFMTKRETNPSFSKQIQKIIKEWFQTLCSKMPGKLDKMDLFLNVYDWLKPEAIDNLNRPTKNEWDWRSSNVSP